MFTVCRNLILSIVVQQRTRALRAVNIFPPKATTHCSIVKMTQKVEDNRLEVFRRICDEISEEASYIGKAKILQQFFRKGNDGAGFQGDTVLWVNLLVPAANQRVYNLQNKQMVKLFARIFATDAQKMQLDLEQEGDVSETLRKFFESSVKLKPQAESTMYLDEVEDFLLKLEQKTKEDEQSDLLRQLCRQATALDLQMIIRLIKKDLRINAGARHILDAFGPFAYPAYQSTRDLAAVVQKFSNKTVKEESTTDGASEPAAKQATGKKNLGKKGGQVQVMTPISPMLANACKSVDEALKKCPSGMYSEIKYDGERVQIHKRGNEFKFFSRNLKPVMDHKVKRFKEYIPKAFPTGEDMILDSEIIMVDTVTGGLLPFGTLGAHKQKEHTKAEVCLFVFDCIFFNGEDLTNTTLRDRRKILEDHIKPIQCYIQLSESRFLKSKNELSVMTAKVLKANLEGVVLKNPAGTYQPGKRGWLKVKKDYLFGGKMADTADLVVLGASFGNGKNGGVLSIFLMGCRDPVDGLWKTVTKVHTGLDDATSARIHEELMELMERADANKLPTWILCNRPLVPDYIAKCPKKMPVWEITGAEFTKSESHTASGISIRFPRITKLRDDKTAEESNDLSYLRDLYEASKSGLNVDLLMEGCEGDEAEVTTEAVENQSKLTLTPKKTEKRKKRDDVEDMENNEEAENDSNKKMKVTNSSDSSATKTKKEEISSTSKAGTKQTPKGRLSSDGKKQRTLDFFTIRKAPDFSKTVKPESNEVAAIKPASEKKQEAESKPETLTKPDPKMAAKTNNTNVESKIKTTAEPMDEDAAEAENTSNIFADLTAHFSPDIKQDKWEKIFISNGGKIAKDSRDADIAFHATYEATGDLAFCREHFKRTCRHLLVSWVSGSALKGNCIEHPDYAVAPRPTPLKEDNSQS